MHIIIILTFLIKMLRRTTQSKKVSFTEEENNYISKTSEEEWLRVFACLTQSRENVSAADEGDEFTDRYDDSQGTHHHTYSYPAYDAKMLRPTAQSKNISFTEEEKKYVSKTSDEELIRVFADATRTRENICASEKGDEFSDHYDESKGTQHHIYPAYDDPFGDTPFRIGCRLLAEVVSKHVTNQKASLLDIGAGSGYLSDAARTLGFSNIDCLEPSQSMIDKQPKDLFGKVLKEIISVSQPCSIQSESYDCVMSSGTVVSGHIEAEDFLEIFRIVKRGGYVIFNIADFWFKHNNHGIRLDAAFQSHLENGQLELVVKERKVYFYPSEDATIYVLKKAV